MINHTIPLGGIGTGYLLLDQWGRFFSHLPYEGMKSLPLNNTFSCIRVQKQGAQPYLRLLCGKLNGYTRFYPNALPPLLNEDEYQRDYAYPWANFKCSYPQTPVSISWRYFSPFVPYDPVAAAMPLELMQLRVVNKNPFPVRVSVLFLVDNLLLLDSNSRTSGKGNVYAVQSSLQQAMVDQFKANGFRGTITELPPEMVKSYEFNGLVFGERRKDDSHVSPFNACLMLKKHPSTKISLGAYDPEDIEKSERFWRYFTKSGTVPAPRIPQPMKGAALVATTDLPAGSAHQFNKVFVWYLPENQLDKIKSGRDEASNVSSSSQGVAQYALQHIDYYATAVDKWQQKLLTSNLPPEFVSALLHASRSFTTQSSYNGDGHLMLWAGVANCAKRACSWNFLTGMAFLIFSPHYHTKAITECFARINHLLTSNEYPNTPESLSCTASLFLSAYADALFLGHRARLAEWLKPMENIVDTVLHDFKDGSPSMGALRSAFDLRGMGLWAGALSVFSLMLHEVGESQKADKYQQMATVFSLSYGDEIYKKLVPPEASGSNGTEASPASASEIDSILLEGPCSLSLLGIEPKIAFKKTLKYHWQSFKNQATAAGRSTQDFLGNVVDTIVGQFYKRSSDSEAENIKDSLSHLVEAYYLHVQEQESKRETAFTESLSMWAVLQMINGFYYDALHQSLYLRPIMINDEALRLPLFTPLSMGDLVVQKNASGRPGVTFTFSIEIPVSIQSVNILLPMVMDSIVVECNNDGHSESVESTVTANDDSTHLSITFKKPLKVLNDFALRITDTSQNQSRTQS